MQELHHLLQGVAQRSQKLTSVQDVDAQAQQCWGSTLLQVEETQPAASYSPKGSKACMLHRSQSLAQEHELLQFRSHPLNLRSLFLSSLMILLEHGGDEQVHWDLAHSFSKGAASSSACFPPEL